MKEYPLRRLIAQTWKKTPARASLLVLLLTGLSGCGGPKQSDQRPVDTATSPADESSKMDENAPEGLSFRLHELSDVPDELIAPRLVEGAALSAEQTEQLLGRLPALPDDAAEKSDFALRTRSKPAPRTGDTVERAFPPEDELAPAAAKSDAPMELLRYAPEGEVGLAPKLSLTFSQPAVELGSQADAAKTQPATIEPEVKGSWRWVGTQTALFEPDGERFPMATDYQVRLNPSLKSATGEALKESAEWSFSLPAPSISRVYPQSGRQELRPKIFIAFDQRISPEKLLESIEFRQKPAQDSSAQSAPEAELLSMEQIEADKHISRLVEQTPREQWIAFRPSQELRAASEIEVVVRAGAPSAEGDKPTDKEQSFSFKTYEPLRLGDRHTCTESNPCHPGEGLSIWMNNSLDEDAFDPAWVSVEPELPGMEVHAQGSMIRIDANTRPRIVYTVRLAAELRDVFGQRLGKPVSADYHVGKTYPFLTSGGDLVTVLDPALEAKFPFQSINFSRAQVVVHRVSTEDWSAYKDFLLEYTRKEGAKIPGEEVLNEAIEIDAEPERLAHSAVDLKQALGDDKYGHFIVAIRPTAPQDSLEERRHNRFDVLQWVQVTDLAIGAFISPQETLGWASNLADGAPLSDVELSLLHGDSSAKTGADGLATLQLPDAKSNSPRPENALIARRGEDSAILPESHSYWSHQRSGWVKKDLSSELLWHVFDDRGIYRPGETAHLKGWLRALKPTGEERLTFAEDVELKYRVQDSRGNEIGAGEAAVDAAGSFNFAVDLADDVNLGAAQVLLSAKADGAEMSTGHRFQIQEFRRPEFEVSVEKSAGPHLLNTQARLDLKAAYYSGGPLGGAPANWSVSSRAARYTPPGQSDFVFGRYSPWWWWMPGRDAPPIRETLSGHTDASGEHHLEVDFTHARPALPHTVEVNGAVTDVNRQTWSASTSLLVHPAEVYVGVRAENSFVEAGEPFELDMIVTDIDGKPVAGRPVELRAARIVGRWKQGQYEEEERDVETCELSSEDAAASCEITPTRGGSWRIVATTRDESGRKNMTELPLWVAGGELPEEQRAERQEVRLIPEKEQYQAGERAKLLIQAPFSDAEALITVRRNGVISKERLKIEGSSRAWEYELTEDHYPQIDVQVDLVGSAPRGDEREEIDSNMPAQPAYASGSITLKVPPKRRELDIKISPQNSALAPGEAATLDLSVTDVDGEPVPDATVALIAVDEAILALSDYSLQDPLQSFYPAQAPNMQDYYLHQHLILARPQDIDLAEFAQDSMKDEVVYESAMPEEEMASAPAPRAAMRNMAKADNLAGADPAPIAMREDFRPLAHFAPAVRTDAAGSARVEFELPDNLTRYRLMAVASAGETHFGTGESALTARLPLMVRPSPPRFLNYGDRVELPVVVQNQTDAAMQVDVAARAANLRLGEARGKRVDVPANDRVEVRFKAVTDKAGTAVLQVASASGDQADAATHQFPVWTPATTEAFATYGTLDDDGAQLQQPLKVPAESFTQFGALDITTSSTALQSLTDALIYLVDYPFSCSEQVASRIMGVGALRDVLDAFDSPNLPAEAELLSAMERDIRLLGTLQRPDGGFYLWSDRDRDRFPYVEVHVTHGLQRAKMAGFTVPDAMLKKATEHLRQIERYIDSSYSELAKNALIAYAYYVLDLMGEPPLEKARKLAAKKPGEELSMEAIGWLISVLGDDKAAQTRVEELSQFLQNRVDETAAAAQFTTSYGGADHLLMYSSRRTDAVLLDAWMAAHPDSDLNAKLVRGLLDHKTRGRWLNTQENAFVLLALERYFKTYEEQTPDFVANIWLGEDFAGGHTFKGREVDYQNTSIPMQTFVEHADDEQKNELLLQKTGVGRLYYRLGMTYAPKSLKLEPFEAGFSVERTYEGVDDPEDVTRLDDGTWQVKAGSRVRVKLNMVAPSRRYHVALVDPLPAGLEPLNPALAVSEALPADDASEDPYSRPYWWWYRPWYSHENLRDERAEAFAPLLYAGVFEYSYITRATTPGEFVVPPAKAEEMYHPETFGRSGTDRMLVK